jgi:hypothetical protein
MKIPHEWETELASTCFARCYNGEGSYYCPCCKVNNGSVWVGDDWRPTKEQAICHPCRQKWDWGDQEALTSCPWDEWSSIRDIA